MWQWWPWEEAREEDACKEALRGTAVVSQVKLEHVNKIVSTEQVGAKHSLHTLAYHHIRLDHPREPVYFFASLGLLQSRIPH